MTTLGTAGAPRPGSSRPESPRPGAVRSVSARDFARNQHAGAYWTYLVLALIAALAVGSTLATAALGSTVTALYLAAWVVTGGLAYALVCRADLNWSVPGRVRLAAVAWGALCLAYAVPLSTWLDAALPTVTEWGAVAHGPLAEESVKLLGIVLIALVAPAVFSRPVGALTVGMIVGVGFTFAENARQTIPALAGDQQASLFAQLLRLGAYGAPWAHLLFTGIAALGVWYVVAHHERALGSRLAVAAACLLLATALNVLQSALGSSFGLDTVTIGYWGVQLALLLALVAWARRVDERWFRSLTQHGLPPVMDAAEAVSLTTRRSRWRSRSVGAAREVQNAQLRYVNAISDGDGSVSEDMRHRVRLLRIPEGGEGIGGAESSS